MLGRLTSGCDHTMMTYKHSRITKKWIENMNQLLTSNQSEEGGGLSINKYVPNNLHRLPKMGPVKKRASVLVAICNHYSEGGGLLYTVRSEKVGTHKGQGKNQPIISILIYLILSLFFFNHVASFFSWRAFK